MEHKFIHDFTVAAQKAGIDHLNYYMETVERASLEMVQREIRATEQSRTVNCFVQGEFQGNCGHYYTGDFDGTSIREGIESIKQISEVMEDTFYPVEIAAYEKAETGTLSEQEDVKNRILHAENLVRAQFPDIRQFDCHYREERKEIRLQNEAGDCMSDGSCHVSFTVGVEAEKNGIVQTARVGNKASSGAKLDIPAMFMEAAKEASELLDASPAASGRYPVILKNSVMNEMLGMFIATFGADMVHRKLSKYNGKIGEKVASSLVNLVEEPWLPEGIRNRRFDDEGVPTSRKEIIKDGILMTYLYNKEEAGKDKCMSTGNGFKSDYKNKAEIHVTNLKLIGEEKTRDALIRQMKDGLYIVSCDGMFAGADIVSGDFSLISKGYLIKNGKTERAVNQITVAGNFFDMLGNIEGIANDYLIEGGDAGAYLVPSVYIAELVISGV